MLELVGDRGLVPAIAFVVTLVAIPVGMQMPTLGLGERWPSAPNWQWILLAYAFAASVLPVWLLLQPRDYLNSHQLITALVALSLGGLLLARRPGWVFTRQQIIDEAQGEDAAVTSRSVDVHVVAIRRKLGDAKDLIETVRGVGYRFKDVD